MSAMRIQIAQVAPTLLLQRREELLHDVSLPLTARGSPIGYADDGTPWFSRGASPSSRAERVERTILF